MFKNPKTYYTPIGLIALQFFIDIFFARWYPDITVSPFRASLIGGTALVILCGIGFFIGQTKRAVSGALSIFLSAFLGALLVQKGYLISKSVMSGVVHVLILIAAYIILTIYIEEVL